ncbi:MAG: DUF1501 domain-containing protein [Bacteroidetes bacterium]|nr:DUF1501 domain-containing protein [Bacteroidota bacterium]
MKRRTFIKRTAPVAALPVLINGMSIKSHASSSLLRMLAAKAENDKVLVLVQLNGGNDGLNTIIPLDQYTNLTTARSNIIIPSAKVLKLNGFENTGLHPSMTDLQNLFNNEASLNIVQAVGYPSPNFSHFRATDIWLSASDSKQYISSGWVGRYLDDAYPGFPENYPNTDMPDPLAISIGGVVSPAVQGPEVNMGMAISNPTSFYNFAAGITDPVPNTPAGKELEFLRLIANQTDKYADRIKTTYNASTTKTSKFPSTGNYLADQLKIVARLIAGGLKTKIYVVTLGGFDTHSNQVSSSGGTETGGHADLLSKVSIAVGAFMDECNKQNMSDRVAGIIYSEFGRRILSNASLGTDHGAAAPVMVFGTQVNRTIIGSNPTIPSTVTVNDNVAMQNDFRQIYYSTLVQWFGLSKTEADTIMLKNFDTLQIFKTTGSINSLAPAEITMIENYPNPFDNSTTIKFNTKGGRVVIRIFDPIGNEIKTLVNKTLPAGTHEVVFEAHSLPPGNYYYNVLSGNSSISRVMLKK